MSVPYVTGSNISYLPTAVFKTAGSLATCAQLPVGSLTPVLAPIGTDEYTLLMWCPAITARYGGTDTQDIPQTNRLSGFVSV